MTIQLYAWHFGGAAIVILGAFFAGIAIGRIERRDEREVAAAEQRHADAPTIVFARPALLQVRPELPWLNPSYPPLPNPDDADLYSLTPDGEHALAEAYASLDELLGDEQWNPTPTAERSDERDDDDFPRGLAAAVSHDIEHGMDIFDGPDDQPTVPHANVVVRYSDIVVNGHPIRAGAAFAVEEPVCRRGAWLERLAGWLADVREAAGIDRSPGWRPGELVGVMHSKHAADETSTQADDYTPRHTRPEPEPAPVVQKSPLTLVRRTLAPATVALRRRQHAAHTAIRQLRAAQMRRRAA